MASINLTLTIGLVLGFASMIIAILSANGKAPLWVAVVLLSIWVVLAGIVK